MRIYLIRTEPIQELAAEPETLARLKTALRPYATPDTRDRQGLGGPTGFGLPLVADPAVAPGVGHYRPTSQGDQPGRGDLSIQIQAEEMLRIQVRAALQASGMTQASAAAQLHISPKHMSQMLLGRAALPLHWGERILELCNLRLVIRSEPAAHDQPREQP